MNYFALFELPEQYDISVDVLTQRYRTLQSMTQSGRFAGASEQEKRLNMQKNVQVNDGYRVLSDDIARGEHLIEVRGTELPHEQELIGDNAFLMELMDLRESLASANEVVEFEQLNRTIAEMIADYRDRINILLIKNDRVADFEAGIELGKLKFMRKLASETKAREQKFLNL